MSFYVHPSAIVDDGATIGNGTRVWHFVHICSGAKIGENASIGQGVFVASSAVVGDKCKIQNNVSLYDGVELENGVFCGPSCVFTNVVTPRAEYERKDEFKRTPVGRGATIGANATIVCGHSLGAYCFIAAGAVITKDVKPHALMAGVPALQIGWVSHAGRKLGPDLRCPEEGKRYKISDDGFLLEIS